ncbi:MAG: UDP-N-acetylmuramoyl-L-alanyl-D-glutamate--2,6-diaminopimelate ligase, partial [Candidatus Omnitrophica bacterium]|nr:UDP-N-acetylmuramoyl-L-alanyl-D-glutamate--2,6-diaminopimelate ligase [Candidatus Omnitrophota bacterium]
MPEWTKGLEFSGITDDSRAVKKGDLFFAIEGQRFNGSGFIDEAIARGAVAVVTGKNTPRGRKTDVRIIRLACPRAALGEAASDFYGNPSEKIKVIGVTGTNGKTTITYLLERIFKKAGYKAGIIGTIAHRWGDNIIEARNTTPGSIELQHLLSGMARDGARYCVMEVSSHSLDQDRVRGVDFKTAIFTNITGEHLDYHKTFEKYLDAKITLFANLKKGATAVLNADDPSFKTVKRNVRARVLTYGIKNEADIRADEIKFGLDASEFVIRAREVSFKVFSPLIGVFNIYNILAAAAAALNESVSIKYLKAAISTFRGAEGRLEPVDTNRDFKIFIDYAHTDNALENVLKALRPYVRNRLITVFGCGGDRDRFKRPRMGRVASELSDYVIITSDNPRSEAPRAIATEIEAGINRDFKSREVVLDRRQAIARALGMASGGDIVLIAGKGHEKYQIMGDKTLPFSDRDT